MLNFLKFERSERGSPSVWNALRPQSSMHAPPRWSLCMRDSWFMPYPCILSDDFPLSMMVMMVQRCREVSTGLTVGTEDTGPRRADSLSKSRLRKAAPPIIIIWPPLEVFSRGKRGSGRASLLMWPSSPLVLGLLVPSRQCAEGFQVSTCLHKSQYRLYSLGSGVLTHPRSNALRKPSGHRLLSIPSAPRRARSL